MHRQKHMRFRGAFVRADAAQLSRLLHARAGEKIGEIADVTALDRFEIGRCLNRLTDLELVERDDGDGDRLRVRMMLIPAGRDKFQACLRSSNA